ncbi:ABC transporter permease [Shouchella lonarensis]|uniref:ABC-2 type transport system permease protein n=1 Tax=Shouchella lonarensis TaxID=1464122 RepID=A0A1G6MWQ1_9BACI|nr:ABC transporter permease [Shouchella lonarensis]SDC59674.1 ABC-2 type transport system permease protein [Shouchella lonarensis]
MWALARVEMKKQLQDKALFFFTLVLPIVMIVLFMNIFLGDEPKEALAGHMVMALSVFFSVFIIISIVTSFVKDRDKGIVARLASTPLSLTNYVIGKSLPFFAIVAAQLVILAALGIFAYGMAIHNWLLYMLMVLLWALVIAIWGAAVAMFSKTENTGILITQIVAMGGALAGGLWMPYELLPNVIRVIGKFTPQYWTHQSMMTTTVSSPDLGTIGVAVLVLIATAGLGLLVSMVGYRTFLKRARS